MWFPSLSLAKVFYRITAFVQNRPGIRIAGTIRMKELEINKIFTLIEPGPVTLITTADDGKPNIMALSWSVVLGYDGRFAIMTGPWNYSYKALMKNRECVVHIPGVELIEKVIGVGTTTGEDTDKFERFGLTAFGSKLVAPPSIRECMAGIECRVADFIKDYDLIVLQAVYAWVVPGYKDMQAFHYRGDGTFIADGQQMNYRREMASKIPSGV